MAYEALEEIKKAEEKAEEILFNAKNEAEKIIADAKLKAKEMLKKFLRPKHLQKKRVQRLLPMPLILHQKPKRFLKAKKILQLKKLQKECFLNFL